MTEEQIAAIEARARGSALRCCCCDAPARWTDGGCFPDDFCEEHKDHTRYSLEPITDFDLAALDLVAEVRRLRAELAQYPERRECPNCNGEGYVQRLTCGQCRGDGVIEVTR